MHRLDGVHREIQDHLLQLDWVGFHGRKLIVEVRFNFYTIFLDIVPQIANADKIRELMSTGLRFIPLFSKHGTDVGHHIRRAMSSFPDMGQRGLCFFNIGGLSHKPT